MGTVLFGPGERWALVSAIAYTVVNVMLRAAAPSIDPVLGSLLRQVPLAIVAWFMVARGGFAEYRPRDPAFLGWRLISYLLAAGAISFVVGNVLYFLALTNGGLGITVSGIQAGSVLGGLWIGLLFLRERPRSMQVAGAVLILAGLVFVAIASSRGDVADLWWLGLVFALMAGTSYAASNALNRVVQKARPVLFVALAGSSLGGMVPLALVALVRSIGQPGSMAVDGPSVAAVLLAGCANAVALAGLALAVRTATVATVNTISSAAIVLSFVASVTIFGETGSLPMVAGVLFVTAGIVVAQLRRGGPGPHATAPGAPVSDRAAAS